MADPEEMDPEVDYFGLKSSRCEVCKHPQSSDINRAILAGDLRQPIARRFRLAYRVVERHTAQHLPTLWERCHVCAVQVVGGPRCGQHNPTPEEREARNHAVIS